MLKRGGYNEHYNNYRSCASGDHSIILILSVVHISAKTDEMSSTLKEINEKLGKIMYNTGKKD